MSNLILTNLIYCLILNLYTIISFNYNYQKGDKAMRAKQNIFITLAIASMTLIASGTVFAHSNDDNSKVPFKRQLLEEMISKIERNTHRNLNWNVKVNLKIMFKCH